MKKVLFVLAMGCLVVTVSAQTKSTHERMEAKATVDGERFIRKVNTEPTLFMPQTTLVSNPVNLTGTSKMQKINYDEESRDCRPGRDIAENLAPSSYNKTIFDTMGTIGIIPDSVMTSVLHVHNHSGDTTYPLQQFHGMGYVFDPYSYGWTVLKNENFFGSVNDRDGFCAYRIDSVAFWATYQIVTYNPSSLDSLIFYVSSHDMYIPPIIQDREEYGYFEYTNPIFGRVAYVRADTTGSYNEKGNHLAPLAYTNGASSVPPRSVRYAFALTSQDSVASGFIRAIRRSIPFEVPAGHVASIICEFKPGYTYDHGDSSLVVYEDETVGDNQVSNYQHNYFAMAYWGLPDPDADPESFQNSFWWFRGGQAGGGYNTSLVADAALRYNNDPESTTGTRQLYNPSYYVYPASYLWVSQGDECIDTTTLGVLKHNISDLLSSIYPNPASDKITVELKDGGKASIEVVNLLGQVVKAVAASDVKTSVDVSTLTSGIYIIRVRQNDKTQTAKFVKE